MFLPTAFTGKSRFKKIITQARSGLEFQESVLLVVVCSPQTKHLFSNLVF